MKKVKQSLILLISVLLLTFQTSIFAADQNQTCDLSSVEGKTITFSQLKSICPSFANVLHRKSLKHTPLKPDQKLTLQKANVEVQAYQIPELNKTCINIVIPGANSAICLGD